MRKKILLILLWIAAAWLHPNLNVLMLEGTLFRRPASWPAAILSTAIVAAIALVMVLAADRLVRRRSRAASWLWLASLSIVGMAVLMISFGIRTAFARHAPAVQVAEIARIVWEYAYFGAVFGLFFGWWFLVPLIWLTEKLVRPTETTSA